MDALKRIFISSMILASLCFCTLDAQAKIPRSKSAISEFKRQNPCPSTNKSRGACPDYVIDHIKALACGGEDAPHNMQWQTVAEGKDKDKWERYACKKGKK